jgi:putative isomerase
MLENLVNESQQIGKPAWRRVLRYTAELHARSVHSARAPFLYPWEEIGPGYCYGPAFGHWDLVHQVLDVMPAEPEHARHQILNDLATQEKSGLVPGSIYMHGEATRWSHGVGHPPVWPVAVQDYAELIKSDELIAQCYLPLVRQIRWFEANRQAQPQGFYYRDILTFQWESGVDEGVRFHLAQPGPYACVDATAHVFNLYQQAAEWSKIVGQPAMEWQEKAAALQEFIQNRLWDTESGWFYDIWSVNQPQNRHLAFEGMFPMVMGAAAGWQCQRVIDENLLNPRRFFASHPISTVGLEDPLFELRMWCGPAWNSMTYWAARGCLRNGRPDAALALLEPALDQTTRQFERTGTIWEFYNSLGGDPEQVRRKPQTKFNQPCRDYLGHNPLLAMARLWEQCKLAEK